MPRISKSTPALRKSKRPSLQTRSAGVLLHPTSLPGPFACGDIGPAAHRFAATLALCGQKWWQMLPVGPVGEGFSPYASVSSFAGEEMLISPELLRQEKLIDSKEIPKAIAGGSRIAFRKAQDSRRKILLKAFARGRKGVLRSTGFQVFRERERHWLDDYALFQALSTDFATAHWWKWPEAYRKRDRKALSEAKNRLAESVDYHYFVQYLFQKQWHALRATCAKLSVGLIGDVPIFVAAGSADTWANQDSFLLDRDGRPKFVAGCPPDDFNRNGQLWGNALYDWPALTEQRFDFWMKRLSRILELFDSVRLDHFIGFRRYWRIPQNAKTAKEGRWIEAPGDEFFAAVASRVGTQALFAEDLGSVTPAVRKLRDDFNLPGMKLLQFAFGNDTESLQHRPHSFSRNSIVYTGTHDNDTTVGWIKSLREAHKTQSSSKKLTTYDRLCAYLGKADDGTMSWRLVQAAFQSQAAVCIVPIQDILGQGGRHRMNVPGTATGNWSYRLQDGLLTPDVQTRWQRLTMVTDRN